MVYRVFEIPEFHEFVDTLGVGPDFVEGGDAQQLVFPQDGEQLTITFDAPGRSVHLRWTRDGSTIVEMFREGAVGVRLAASVLTVAFDTDDQRGELQVRTAPSFELRDRLLLR